MTLEFAASVLATPIRWHILLELFKSLYAKLAEGEKLTSYTG